MQTFLPYPSFEQSARVLDRQRLGKQRVEAKQIIDTLEGRSFGWSHHPAVRMWIGYVDALKLYFNVVSREWEKRGYKHNLSYYKLPDSIVFPPWLGNEVFHYAHRASLYRKNPIYYFGWTGIDAKTPYVWPV